MAYEFIAIGEDEEFASYHTINMDSAHYLMSALGSGQTEGQLFRGHNEVLFGLLLTFDFLSHFSECSSRFHSDLLVKK